MGSRRVLLFGFSNFYTHGLQEKMDASGTEMTVAAGGELD